MAINADNHSVLLASRLADAARGDADACYDLGISYSSGAGGFTVDLVEAHKWFNLAALSGLDEAQAARADIADEMSAREIAQAQREARDWLALTVLRAA